MTVNSAATKSGVPDATKISANAAASEPINFSTRLAGQWSLREACLASLRHCSASNAELLTSVGSGPNSSDWCASFDPATCSLRTRQQSLFSNKGEPGTELCQDWSRAGMIVSGMYFPQPLLVQDICESGSTWSLPTPLTQDHTERANSNGNVKKWGGDNTLGAMAHSGKLTGAKWLLPTPRAGKTTTENEETWQARRQAGKVATRPLALEIAYRSRLLPTPTASNGGPDRTRKNGKKLITKLVPTPTAADGERGGRGDLLAIVKDRPNQHTKWLVPTPTARDWKDTPGMAMQAGDRNRDDQLPRRIYAQSESTTKTGGRLNPLFSLWLMGYPVDWLKPLYDALATPSCRKSPPASAEPSSNSCNDGPRQI